VEKRVFGKTGMQVSVLGFGGAEIGFENAQINIVERLLGSALDAGLNVIDTAECYESSEELIGKAVAHRRKDYHLFTKCGHGASYLDDAWEAASITKSIDRSLKRLKTDHLDLVQLHSCSADVLKRGDVVEALLKARDAGKTRFVGYSGDGQDALYAIEMDVFDTFQTSVSIADQESIALTIPLATQKNMGVIAKRPVANAAWRHAKRPVKDYSEPYWLRLQELKYDFINGNPQASIATALRFTLSVPGVHTAIVGTSKPDRWLENAQLVNQGPLPADEYETIRRRWQAVAGKDWVGQV